MSIIVILILILLNGFLAMSEIAILSAPKPRLKKLANDGDKNAQIAMILINNSSNLLSSIQIGITLIGVIAGAFGGQTIAEPLGRHLSAFGVLGDYNEFVAYFIVVSFITYFSIVIGELVPKRLAISNSLSLTLLSAPWIHRLSKLMHPFVSLLSSSTNLIVSLLPIKYRDQAELSEADVLAMIHEGVVLGIFEPSEKTMFERMLIVGDTPVSEMMTPIQKTIWLNVQESTDTWRKLISQNPHYYYPVCDGSIDNIAGIIRAEDILTDFLDDSSLNVKELLLVPQYIHEDKTGLAALEVFRLSGIHLALVKSDEKNVIGIISSNDVLEFIAGGLPEIDEIAKEYQTNS